MSALNTINYAPPPILRAFLKDYRPHELFYDWVVGPFGSGKTTALFFKLCRMAALQQPGPDGVRRTRAVVVRNTAPQLRDTTLASWNEWFKDGQAGHWKATEKNFTLRFSDVECEVLFRPLDTPDDIARVLSLEVTFALLDEFVQIPKAIVEALSGRLGRYPSAKDGGATNWGMWGASNPGTEDVWWYDYLHKELPSNAVYFKQPSGLSPEAENIENLPGGRGYYDNLVKGKSDVWIKQFVESEWGFSIAGKAVVGSFKPAFHIGRKLLYNPHLPLVAGFDPGLAGSALVFGQQDLTGRLVVLGELVQSNMGSERIIRERLNPYLRRRFPESDLIIAPDPASNNRSQKDEVEIIRPFKDKFTVSIETNNRLPLRLDAIDHFATTIDALKIDEDECPVLIRALKGGWRYTVDPKKEGMIKGIEPEKNPYSHVGDAMGYLSRYFHKQTQRELRYAGANGKAGVFVPPRRFGSGYHFR